MEAYRSSRAFMYLNELDKEKRVCVEYEEEIKDLTIPELRAKHVKEASDKFCLENRVQK